MDKGEYVFILGMYKRGEKLERAVEFLGWQGYG
jgi:hypothetical protein